MKRVDVLIVGGGPAAAAMAMYTDESLRVLVVEKRTLLDDEHFLENEKCCGGMLDDTAQKVVTRMGIALPDEVMASPQVFSCRAVDFMSHKERTYHRNYLNIDRVRFDRMLLKSAAQRSNVEVMENTICYDFMEAQEGVAVCLRHADGSTEVIFTRYLIGADGAQSVVRKKLSEMTGKGPVIKPRVYVSIQEWYDVDENLPHYMAMFDNKVTDFYSWVIPKESDHGPQIMVGSAMPQDKLKKRSAQERFDRMKANLTEIGLDLSRPTKRLGAVIMRPAMFGSCWTGEGRVFLIGEAACLISPSSAEGISFALRSGIKMAQAIRFAQKHHRLYVISKPFEEIFRKKKKTLSEVAEEKVIKEAAGKGWITKTEEDAKYTANGPAAKKGEAHADYIRTRYLSSLVMMKLSIALKTLKAPLMYNFFLRNLIFATGLTAIKHVDKPSNMKVSKKTNGKNEGGKA